MHLVGCEELLKTKEEEESSLSAMVIEMNTTHTYLMHIIRDRHQFTGGCSPSVRVDGGEAVKKKSRLSKGLSCQGAGNRAKSGVEEPHLGKRSPSILLASCRCPRCEDYCVSGR